MSGVSVASNKDIVCDFTDKPLLDCPCFLPSQCDMERDGTRFGLLESTSNAFIKHMKGIPEGGVSFFLQVFVFPACS